MSGIGDRHSGSAGGALIVGGRPVSVEIRLGADAHLGSAQHTAWMLLNMLCRLQGAVNVIRLHCPAGVKAVRKLSPLVPSIGTLLDALLAGAKAIGSPASGVVPVEIAGEEASEIVVGVSFAFSPDCTFSAIGNGLSGGIFTRPIAGPEKFSSLTIGPYAAACLAAGEIFRQVRLNDYLPERQLFLNLLDHSHAADPVWTDLGLTGELRSTLLAGVGAVGSAVLHCLYPLEISGTLWAADNDEKGIEDTNLNRYSLFGWNSIGRSKASEAAKFFEGSSLTIVSHDGGFEHFFEGDSRPEIVLSAVDKNGVRHALQERYAPLIYSASTLNLRAEVLRCGPPSVGACLACFNPMEAHGRTEDQIRSSLLERPDLIESLCEKLHLDQKEVARWIRERKCSETGERLVEQLRSDDGSLPAFAVGFVSVLAGVMLAVELLKILASWSGMLNESQNRVVFQFQNPTAGTNRAHSYGRDETCSVCNLQNTGAKIWGKRYDLFKTGMTRQVRRD